VLRRTLVCLGVGLALALPATARAATTRSSVLDGERNVEWDPLGRRATYERSVFVFGVPREKVIAALPGPATGPEGFAPKMVSATPVERQFDGTRVRTEKMRLPGLPEAAGATVEGWPTEDGMAFRMSDGLTSGDFTIVVGPERRLSDGDIEVKVVEAGYFTILQSPPKSLLGIPAFLLANFTPPGWLGQATGGAAICHAHIELFQLEAVLARRLHAAR
jgi:hypothetical protein